MFVGKLIVLGFHILFSKTFFYQLPFLLNVMNSSVRLLDYVNLSVIGLVLVVNKSKFCDFGY